LSKASLAFLIVDCKRVSGCCSALLFTSGLLPEMEKDIERISAWDKEGSSICIDTNKKAITNDRNDR